MTDATNNLCPQCGATVPPDAPGGGCPSCLVEAALDPEPPAGVPSRETLGSLFPELEIQSLLGRGGMGAVFKARQTKLERTVALKVLPPQEGARGAAFADRFAREARALARLDHRNIVRVYEFGERQGLFFLVMEYVDGVNLREAMLDGDIAPRQALAIIPQVCDALQFAHDHGVVHRDIKPENVLLATDGAVKVADFGLAKLVVGATEDVTLTRAGQVMGTLHYMAPEQLESPASVDHRADIYSLGVVFYEMLTGDLPLGRFEVPSHRAQVDARLDEVVMRALERKRERRYQKASDVKSAVSGIDDPGTGGPVVPPPLPRLRRRPWAGVSVPALLSLAALPMALVAAPLAGGSARLLGGNVHGAYVAMASTLGILGLVAVLLGIAGLVDTRGARKSGRWMASVGLIAALVWTPALASASYYGLDVVGNAQQERDRRAEEDRQTRLRVSNARAGLTDEMRRVVPYSDPDFTVTTDPVSITRVAGRPPRRSVAVFHADGTGILMGETSTAALHVEMAFRRWSQAAFDEARALDFIHHSDRPGLDVTDGSAAGLPFATAVREDPRRARLNVTEIRYMDERQRDALVTAESDEGRVVFPMTGDPTEWAFAAGPVDVEWFEDGDR